MSYVTEEAIWPPKGIKEDVKDIIVRFYELADSQESDVGERMATQVFTENATLVTATGSFKGSPEISRSRDRAWATVSSRKHRVLRVFTGDEDGFQLVVLGTVRMEFKNGRSLDSPFACHITVDVSSTSPSSEVRAPRLNYMQVFADTAPIAAILAD